MIPMEPRVIKDLFFFCFVLLSLADSLISRMQQVLYYPLFTREIFTNDVFR